ASSQTCWMSINATQPAIAAARATTQAAAIARIRDVIAHRPLPATRAGSFTRLEHVLKAQWEVAERADLEPDMARLRLSNHRTRGLGQEGSRRSFRKHCRGLVRTDRLIHARR